MQYEINDNHEDSHRVDDSQNEAYGVSRNGFDLEALDKGNHQTSAHYANDA